MLCVRPEVNLCFYSWYFTSCWNQTGISIKMYSKGHDLVPVTKYTFKLAVPWYPVGLLYRATCINMPILWLCMFCLVTWTLSCVKTGFVLWLVSLMWSGICNISVVETCIDLHRSVAQTLGDLCHSVVQTLGDLCHSVAQTLGDLRSSVAQTLSDLCCSVAQTLGDLCHSVAQTLGDWGHSVVQTLSYLHSSVVQTLSYLHSSVVQTLSYLHSSVVQTLSYWHSSVVQTLSDLTDFKVTGLKTFIKVKNMK